MQILHSDKVCHLPIRTTDCVLTPQVQFLFLAAAGTPPHSLPTILFSSRYGLLGSNGSARETHTFPPCRKLWAVACTGLRTWGIISQKTKATTLI